MKTLYKIHTQVVNALNGEQFSEVRYVHDIVDDIAKCARYNLPYIFRLRSCNNRITVVTGVDNGDRCITVMCGHQWWDNIADIRGLKKELPGYIATIPDKRDEHFVFIVPMDTQLVYGYRR